MPELHFEPSIVPAQPQLELFTTEEAIERVNRLQVELNAEQVVFMAERSSYGLQNPNLHNWLQKVDAVETLVNRFNVACVRLLRTLRLLATDESSDADTTIDAEVAEQIVDMERQRLRISHQMQLVRMEAKIHQAGEPAPGYAIATGGRIKPAWLNDERYQQHKLGLYGQDVLLIDRHKASVVVADGTSTLPDSHSVANATAHACENVLASVPEELASDLDQLQWYATAAADTIMAALEELPASTIGSTAVFAARYFQKFDALVVIEIGDCEAALATVDAVQQINYDVQRIGEIPHIQKIEGKTAAIVDQRTKPLVRVVSLTEFRRAHPNQAIHLVGGSDGLRNNSGLTLAQQARTIVRDGVEATLEHCAQQKDDMTLFDLELNPVVA